MSFQFPIVFAAWSKDANNRFCSTSGGIFTELANSIIANGGLVSGARYNSQMLVEHCLINNVKDIEQIRQSKYLSSSPGLIFKTIREDLSLGKKVLFCGSPCQVAGLKSFLKKNYDNLITVDFICRGMNSPKAYSFWLNEIEQKKNKKISKVWFKYKDGGWNSSPTRTKIFFDDESSIVLEGTNNLYMYAYLNSNLFMRPCCGKCLFKGSKRNSDITLADYWGIDKKIDDDKGTSMVIVNTQQGLDLFNSISNKINCVRTDLSLDHNPMFNFSVLLPKERHSFLCDLGKFGFTKSLKKYKGYPKKQNLLIRFLVKLKHAGKRNG